MSATVRGGFFGSSVQADRGGADQMQAVGLDQLVSQSCSPYRPSCIRGTATRIGPRADQIAEHRRPDDAEVVRVVQIALEVPKPTVEGQVVGTTAPVGGISILMLPFDIVAMFWAHSCLCERGLTGRLGRLERPLIVRSQHRTGRGKAQAGAAKRRASRGFPIVTPGGFRLESCGRTAALSFRRHSARI